MRAYLETLWKEADAAWDRDPGGKEWLRAVRRIASFAFTCLDQG